MHWWQGAFTSTSKSHSDDESVVIGDGRYASKTGLFSSRRNRHLARARKLRHVSENDVELWNSPARSASSASPQPLPLPELHVLLRSDRKAASHGSVGMPLPSPRDVIPNVRGECEEFEGLNADAIDGINGVNGRKRLVKQETRTSEEQSKARSSRKSPQRKNVKDKPHDTYSINIPISAPTSPYSSPSLSPQTSDFFPTHYLTPPSMFQVWSAPEMPQLDANHGLHFYSQINFEKTASSLDNSPLQSPRLSPPRATSPLPVKISSETPLIRRESNVQAATVHPLPLPPIASKPEFMGPTISSRQSAVPQAACKQELTPIKHQWQKGKLIGRGTFGSVYVASNRETGALCAMKEVEMLPDDSKSAECIRQLEQEIKVLSNLKHPNIVQYYGSEIVGDKFYIYLEYVHPGSINRFIQDHCGAITESVVRNFTRHILCGLAYLHSTKTIHRDIKGANLLVDAYGVVKLADFGMAKHLNGQAAMLSLKGSPYWLAPELLNPAMQKDASSDLALAVDIWSLGCTIIEMMNGKPPWSEYEGAAALFKVLKETPPIPETLSPEGKDFLQCCFHRNPADRPTASKLLDHPFLNCSQQPDACNQSLKETRFSGNTQKVRESPSYKLELPSSLNMQIKNGKLANNFMRDSFSPVRLTNKVITKHSV